MLLFIILLSLEISYKFFTYIFSSLDELNIHVIFVFKIYSFGQIKLNLNYILFT